MKCFVVYDETGRIYAAEYGEKQSLPAALDYLQADLEDGAQLTRVDVADPKNPKLLYATSKENELKKELAEIRESNDKLGAQVAYLSMMSGVDMKEEKHEQA